MKKYFIIFLFTLLCSTAFCVTLTKDWAVSNYAQVTGYEVNCSAYYPSADRFLSNNYGIDLSLEIYNGADGAFINSSALSGSTFSSLGGFSIGVAPNNNIYLSDGSKLYKLDDINDTTVTPVQGSNTFINPSRNISIQGSGINTYIAATGSSDNGPVQIWKADNEECSSFSPWKALTGLSLDPIGAGKAGCAISPVIGSNPPEWVAGCEVFAAVKYMRVFRYNTDTQSYNHAFTQGNASNQYPAYDMAFDFTDGYSPIVAVLTTSEHVIPTATFNAKAMVEVFTLNTFDGSLTLAASYDLKDDLDFIEVRGSLDIDPVNKKIYVGYRTTGGNNHVAMARLSYTLDVPPPPTATPTPTVSPTPSPSPIPTATPEMLVTEGYETQPRALRWNEIIISPGHGFLWNQETNQWGWQRPLIEGTREDWIVQMFCNRWFMPYLHNAGAQTRSTRERCEQTSEVVIDYNTPSDADKITGTWSEFTTGTLNGNKALAADSIDSEIPTASIIFTADIPKSGYYALYFKYPEYPNASKSAPLIVTDGAGNKHNYKINQTVKPNRMNYLETFYFEAGINQDIVEINNAAGESGKVVFADMIRIGGGYGTNDWGGGVSGVPRWQESSKDFMKYIGAPSWVYDYYATSSDYFVRGNFRQWDSPGNIIYEIHSNASAGSGTATGSYSIIYGKDDPERNSIYSSYIKMTSVMQEQWDPGWLRRTPAIYNDSYWNPMLLIELAFHDNVSRDLIFLMDPDFRRITARGLYMGVVDHVTSNTSTYLPETPSAPFVEAQSGGVFEIGWKVPLFGTAPTSYRVYYSEHPYSFVDYETTSSTQLSMQLNLDENKIYYFQIQAVNDGGVSFPTETMAAYSTTAAESFLIVNGFDRLDWKVQEADNPKNFSIQHINAVVDAMNNIGKNYKISYASNDSVQNGKIVLTEYTIVDWYTGEESIRYDITNGKGFTDDKVLNSAEQAKITAYLNSSGKLFVSGSDIAWDLTQKGTAADKTFLNTYLKCDYAQDDGTTYTLQGINGKFAGSSVEIDDGTHEVYDADLPDIIVPANGSKSIYRFNSSTNCAGISYISGTYKLVLFSYPFEAIVDKNSRADVMKKVITTLYSEPPSRVSDWIMLY